MTVTIPDGPQEGDFLCGWDGFRVYHDGEWQSYFSKLSEVEKVSLAYESGVLAALEASLPAHSISCAETPHEDRRRRSVSFCLHCSVVSQVKASFGHARPV